MRIKPLQKVGLNTKMSYIIVSNSWEIWNGWKRLMKKLIDHFWQIGFNSSEAT